MNLAPNPTEAERKAIFVAWRAFKRALAIASDDPHRARELEEIAIAAAYGHLRHTNKILKYIAKGAHQATRNDERSAAA